MLKPFTKYLQNVGLGVTAKELPEYSGKLALLGVSRLCEPGRMAEPSTMSILKHLIVW